MKLIQDLLFPCSFDTIRCGCGHFEATTDKKKEFAQVVPTNKNMDLCESVTSYYSSQNWQPFSGFLDASCNKHKEELCDEELLKNPKISFTDDQKLVLIRPVLNGVAEGEETQLNTFQHQPSKVAEKKMKGIGSTAIISGRPHQCVGCITVDDEGTHSVFIKRLGFWCKITNNDEPVLKYYTEEPIDGVIYLFLWDKFVPHYV